MRFSILFAFSLLAAVSAAGDHTRRVVVDTIDGPVSGVAVDTHTEWRGIPFASPPVGSLRWQPPMPAKPWGPSALDASTSGPGCPQLCQNPAFACPNSTSEDCLTLDVYAPADASPDNLKPVMLWIYGGRFWSGLAGCTAYDGQFLTAQTNAVIVAGNYRLGALGWLYTDDAHLNLGLLDQRAVMQWVQTNIKAFGGDPNRVTLFGESAGAISIGLHMASPGSANLFHAAIMESNPLGLPLHTIETSKALALLFAQNLNCSSSIEGEQHEWIEKLPVRVRNVLTQHKLLTARAVPECLMNASLDNIIFAQTAAATHISLHVPLQVAMPWSPVVDGTIVPCQPIDCFEQKKIVNQVPIILGTTVEEARPFVYAARPDSGLPWYEYNPLLMELFGLKYFFGVNSDYPSNYSSDCRDTLSQLGTDYLFTCANRHIASVYTATTGAPAYLYLFDHVASFDFWSPLFTYCTGHNCHGEELPFVWQTETLAGSQPTPDERTLSQNIATYWGNMGFTYSPNAGSSPPVSWPPFNFTDGTGPILRLTAPAAIVMPGYRADMCAHWDERGYHFD